MSETFNSLTVALDAMLREADRMTFHAGRLSTFAFGADIERTGISKTAEVANLAQSKMSLGRHGARDVPGLRIPENSGFARFNGIELATDMVHIVNVQRNFDADAKLVSTIDTMYDDILNLRV